MRNWKQLVALLTIVLITLVALSPILTVIADGAPPPNGDGAPPPNGDGAPPPASPPPYETPASIYYAIGVVAVIAIIAIVYIGMKGGTTAPQRPQGPPR